MLRTRLPSCGPSDAPSRTNSNATLLAFASITWAHLSFSPPTDSTGFTTPAARLTISVVSAAVTYLHAVGAAGGFATGVVATTDGRALARAWAFARSLKSNCPTQKPEPVSFRTSTPTTVTRQVSLNARSDEFPVALRLVRYTPRSVVTL